MELQKVRIPGAYSSFSFKLFILSACFSLDGARLLTTDQNNEIRVYSASQWDSPLSLISHPHRHFQHLTPIKVSDYGNGSDLAKLGKGSHMQPTISDAVFPLILWLCLRLYLISIWSSGRVL